MQLRGCARCSALLPFFPEVTDDTPYTLVGEKFAREMLRLFREQVDRIASLVAGKRIQFALLDVPTLVIGRFFVVALPRQAGFFASLVLDVADVGGKRAEVVR